MATVAFDSYLPAVAFGASEELTPPVVRPRSNSLQGEAIRGEARSDGASDGAPDGAPDGATAAGAKGARRFHRIQEVRRREGMSLRSAARHLGYDMRRVREQEQSTSDLRISDLMRWQKALDVPIAELLVESEESLSGPVLERARMVRLMKTAAAIQERAGSHPVSRLAQMLIEQLLELMPELQDVGPWHSVGQRRSLNEYGRAAELGLALVQSHDSSNGEL